MRYKWYHKLGLGALTTRWRFFAANMLNDRQIQPRAQKNTATAIAESKTEVSKTELASTEYTLSILAATEVDRRAKLFGKHKAYQTLLKDKNWSYAEPKAFLANPKELVPRTKMVLAKLKKSNQQTDILVDLLLICGSPKILL